MKLALSVAYLIGVLTIIWAVRSLPDPAPSPVVVAAPDAQGTMAVNVNVTLFEATATATAIPTEYPTAAATIRPDLNWCTGNEAAGSVCQKPPAPTATASPYPSCAVAKPGEWCRMGDAP